MEQEKLAHHINCALLNSLTLYAVLETTTKSHTSSIWLNLQDWLPESSSSTQDSFETECNPGPTNKKFKRAQNRDPPQNLSGKRKEHFSI